MKFSVSQECLVVEADGLNDCYNLLIELTRRVYDKVVECEAKVLLLDFQNLEFKIDWTDCFNLVRMYERYMPVFRTIAVACIFSESSLNFGRYWQEIALTRGFNINLFATRDKAERWIMDCKNHQC